MWIQGPAGCFCPREINRKVAPTPFFVKGSKIGDSSQFSTMTATTLDWVNPPRPRRRETGEGSRVLCRRTQHPPLLGEGPLMSSSTIWKFCCLPVLVTLHPKADSQSDVFHDNFVDLGRRHYKYANVSLAISSRTL